MGMNSKELDNEFEKSLRRISLFHSYFPFDIGIIVKHH